MLHRAETNEISPEHLTHPSHITTQRVPRHNNTPIHPQQQHHSVYQGTIKRGGWLHNMKNQKKVKVPRLVRMHSDEMQART